MRRLAPKEIIHATANCTSSDSDGIAVYFNVRAIICSFSTLTQEQHYHVQ